MEGKKERITGRSMLRIRNGILRTLPGTVFRIRLRGKRGVLTRVSNGLEVRCVEVLPKSGIAIRVSPCSLAGNEVA